MTLREVQDGGGGAKGALARAGLSVLSLAYGAGVALRAAAYATGIRRVHALDRPVVSVGNLTVGGTGKTPFVAWLARRLLDAGKRPAVLSRGYGPRPEGSDLSDEGTLLRDLLGPSVPQVEDPDRVRGGRALLARHPRTEVVLLDDGFQHRRLARDLDVVLLDATDPLGAGRLLPRGRLRERPRALRRSDVVVVTRADRAAPGTLPALRAFVARRAPLATLAVATTAPRALARPDGGEEPLEALRGDRVVLYAGVGNPGAFEADVRRLGADVVARRFVPDHHLPDAREPARLASLLAESGAGRVVTTRKDLVKLRAQRDLPAGVVALDSDVEVVEGGAELLRRVHALRAGGCAAR
jgi:tetraacyldisaccharide 4'-kinase